MEIHTHNQTDTNNKPSAQLTKAENRYVDVPIINRPFKAEAEEDHQQQAATPD